MDEVSCLTERRIVAAVSPGVSMHAGVSAILNRHAVSRGEFRLVGRIRDVRLSIDTTGAAFALPGPLLLVSASGLIEPDSSDLEIVGTVAWHDTGLPGLMGGRIEEAVSDGVDVIVEAWQSAEAESTPARPSTGNIPSSAEPKSRDSQRPRTERTPAIERKRPRTNSGASPSSQDRPTAQSPDRGEHEAESGRFHKSSAPTPSTRSRPTAPAPPAEKPAGGWSAAVAASQSSPPSSRASRVDPTPNDEQELQVSDILVHPKFGRCRVARAEDDRVKVRLPSGRLVDLHVNVFRLVQLPDEEGRRVFKAVSRRR